MEYWLKRYSTDIIILKAMYVNVLKEIVIIFNWVTNVDQSSERPVKSESLKVWRINLQQ